MTYLVLGKDLSLWTRAASADAPIAGAGVSRDRQILLNVCAIFTAFGSKAHGRRVMLLGG